MFGTFLLNPIFSTLFSILIVLLSIFKCAKRKMKATTSNVPANPVTASSSVHEKGPNPEEKDELKQLEQKVVEVEGKPKVEMKKVATEATIPAEGSSKVVFDPWSGEKIDLEKEEEETKRENDKKEEEKGVEKEKKIDEEKKKDGENPKNKGEAKKKEEVEKGIEKDKKIGEETKKEGEEKKKEGEEKKKEGEDKAEEKQTDDAKVKVKEGAVEEDGKKAAENADEKREGEDKSEELKTDKTPPSIRGWNIIIPPGIRLSRGQIKWELDTGQHAVKVTNMTGHRVAFKIKTSDITVYSVRPVSDFLEKDASIYIAIVRRTSPRKDDKIVVVATEAQGTDTDSRELFSRPGGIRTYTATLRMIMKQPPKTMIKV